VENHAVGSAACSVRDARWLFPLALSPRPMNWRGISKSRNESRRPWRQRTGSKSTRAGVRMRAGTLRSQLRTSATQKGVPLDENGLVLITRRSNALDLATLIQVSCAARGL